uniref:CBM20 domain-containing protein n=1 Tax=Davidia involucrata TaxID=16924 RepID=A0A5B7B074_DAVIN
METLRSSSSKLFSDKYRRDRGFSSPRRGVLSRLEIRFLRSPNLATVGFSHPISLQHKRIQPIFASSPSSSDPQTHLQNEETQIQDQSKTVHVEFQLQRECLFGERFHIVGGDPMLGSWDPSSAIPLDWSDGHVWTVELDMPIEKSIHFKFILKGTSGNILWQPGQDRILQTWETENTITVSEDWDNAELQKIVEEGLRFNQTEESAIDSEMLIVAENLTQPRQDQTVNVNWESTTTETESITNTTEKPLAIVAENITDPNEKLQVNTNNKAFGTRSITYTKEEHVAIISKKEMTVEENTLGNNGRAVTIKNSGSTKDEEILVSYEGAPILVAGLTPLMPTANTEEASPVEVKKNIVADASLGPDKAIEQSMPEVIA